MTASITPCLYCLEPFNEKSDFHPLCSRKSSGTGKANRLTLVGLWGKFILKPPTKDYPFLPEIEAITMFLARAIKLPVVPHSLIRLDSGELAYITRRIDRKDSKSIAMEDLCQISGRLTEDKYKGSLEQVGKTIRLYSSQPGLDAHYFFELVIFCFLTGNADMQLAPAYDLVASKLVLPQDQEETALTLNGKKRNLRRKDFDFLAMSLMIPQKARENTYNRISKSLPQLHEIVGKSFLPTDLKQAYRAMLMERKAILSF